MPRHLLVVALAGLPFPALAQVSCNNPVGPDLQISDIAGVANYAAANGRDAFSVGTTQTDGGNAWISYAPSTPVHPVIGLGLYRLSTVNGGMRFEQVGQSWLFHGFCALASNLPCSMCVQPPDCSHLGVGCSTTDTASLTGSQVALGPKWQVNPTTGAFAFPPDNPAHSGAIARRLQASLADLNTTDTFFVGAMAVAPDDAVAGNGANNGSYRRAILSGGLSDFVMALSGSTIAAPAIDAWRAALWAQGDFSIRQDQHAAADGGILILSSHANPLPGGLWHYEYALANTNSDAGVGSFSVPVPDSAIVLNAQFHAVAYTDGDGINGVTRDGTDWAWTGAADAITWSTTPFATDPNANALLWGTIYNFRFDSDAQPSMSGTVITAGAWKTSGVASTFAAVGPSTECWANCDGSTIPPRLNVLDFACFLGQVAEGSAAANCDGSTSPPVINVLDFSCFLNKFAAGCP